MKTTAFLAALAGLALGATASAQAGSVIDLTHPIPTFQAMDGDPMKPDPAKPYLDSRPIPTFGQQTVLTLSKFPTSDGHFDLGVMVLAEHHGTHLDTPGHYINSAKSQEAGYPTGDKRKLAHQLTGDDLTGRVVMIDISGRVQAELDKNGGKPSPDKAVTDFSNASASVVGPDDIQAVADKLDNGVWLVLNTGWSKFFFDGADFAKDPYINGWNHPGISKAGVDKLIEIMDAKGITIGGIAADNIGIDSGDSAIGDDDKWTNSWHAHVRLLQRGVKFVENAANLGQLAMANPDGCTLVVGAPKHVRGTGGPSRVFALCN
ncbi:MAG: cyclase family protein [Rhodobacterales bacterium]|nr:cyclase family protein [Rhodobacterales bacterium]